MLGSTLAMDAFAPRAHSMEEARIEPLRHVYIRVPSRVYFPESEEVPEDNRHLEIRTALYLLLKRELSGRATVGSEQFIYWDPTTAAKCLAPDAFVRLGAPHAPFRTWKTWQRGAPELAVEVVSNFDKRDRPWDDKLARYRSAGIRELVRFRAEGRSRMIRIWDLIDGDLVERAPRDPDFTRCEALGLWWTVVEHPQIGPMLRLARDREGNVLLPTPDEEASAAKKEAAKARAENAKARAENARLRAEIAALKAKGGQVTKAPTRKARAKA